MWSQSVNDCLNRSGIGIETRRETIYETTFSRMADIFHQENFAKINKKVRKLRIYGKLKTKIGIAEGQITSKIRYEILRFF